MSALTTAGAPGGNNSVKQAQLGRAIGLNRAVIIQVVTGEIGKSSGAQPHAVQAILVQPV